MAEEVDPRPPLLATLERARQLGFVGPTPVADLVTHALGFAEALAPPDAAVDLGSGAGLPGLVLAQQWPTSRWVLIEAGERRAAFLDQAVRDLGLGSRVSVRWGRAEDLARTELRGGADLVTARSFGPPGVTAECATGFLRPGGQLVVSEPPERSGQRWAPLGHLDLGLVLDRTWSTVGGSYASLHQEASCPDRYPRRVGVPAKRPLF